MFQMGYGGDYGAGGRNQMEVRNHVFNCNTSETCNAVRMILVGNWKDTFSTLFDVFSDPGSKEFGWSCHRQGRRYDQEDPVGNWSTRSIQARYVFFPIHCTNFGALLESSQAHIFVCFFLYSFGSLA